MLSYSIPCDKNRLLQRCGPAAMGSIFKVEVTGELLGQLLLHNTHLRNP
jgi:hypothetical protein